MPALYLILVTFLTLGAASAAHAQSDGGSVESPEREELRARAAELEARLATASSEQAEEIRSELETVRTRLQDGDFRPGDMIALTVVGEETLSDTFVVEPPHHLRLPGLRPIDLTGVLMSEVEPHLRDEIARYVRDPQVMARPLMRVGVLGAVAQPGFYLVPPLAPVPDVFSAAGGFQSRAVMDKVELRRNGRTVLRADSLRSAMSMGTSLARLGVRPGDEFYVPEGEGPIRTREWILIASGVVGMTFTVLRIAGAL